MTDHSCPRCGHRDFNHAGGWCYACGERSPAHCGYSWISNLAYRGWWDWRQGPPPGVHQVTVYFDGKPPELDAASAVREAERILGIRD